MEKHQHIERMNRPVLGLDDSHPAKRFLNAFMDCRGNCVGREIDWGQGGGVDQQWRSAVDDRTRTFSSFAYECLSFDIELDGFLQNAKCLTESERCAVEALPHMTSMMYECAAAAREYGNDEVVEMTDDVLEMLRLWEAYLDFRRNWIAAARQTPGNPA